MCFGYPCFPVWPTGEHYFGIHHRPGGGHKSHSRPRGQSATAELHRPEPVPIDTSDLVREPATTPVPEGVLVELVDLNGSKTLVPPITGPAQPRVSGVSKVSCISSFLRAHPASLSNLLYQIQPIHQPFLRGSLSVPRLIHSWSPAVRWIRLRSSSPQLCLVRIPFLCLQPQSPGLHLGPPTQQLRLGSMLPQINFTIYRFQVFLIQGLYFDS